MMLMWMCTGVAITVGSAGTAAAQTLFKDPLECSQDEQYEAQLAVPPRMNAFYKPLLTEDFSEIRNALTNENSVRWHVSCILYDRACTRLGKAMQYFVTSQSDGRVCRSCQTPCLQRRIRTILLEIHCRHPLIAQEIREYFLNKNQIDIMNYYLGSNPVC